MCGLLGKNSWKGCLLLFFVPWICFGCGDFDQPGSDKSGSLFMIEQIDPNYFEESTRQVDVYRADCADPGQDEDLEEYGDHFADITFSNRPLNNSEEQTASRIDLQEYEIWYEPITSGAPDLASFLVRTVNDGNGIDPCDPGVQCEGETVGQLEFVPVRLKAVLEQHILDTGILQLEYNIYYRFYGENDFGYKVSADGSTFFYAGDYDHCGGGGG
jgi:hypothetical protein